MRRSRLYHLATVSLFVFLAIFLLSSCEKPQFDEVADTDNTEIDDTHSWVDDIVIDDGSEDDTGNDSNIKHKGTYDDMMTVADFINYDVSRQVFVKGYIVGACKQSFSYAEFAPPFTCTSAIILADDKTERDADKLMAVQLKQGKIREKFNLKDTPSNLYRLAYFFGSRKTYLKIAGMKDDIGDYGFLE